MTLTASVWETFLRARADVIDAFHEEGNDDRWIARTLSMDPHQVYLIRTRPNNIPGSERRQP